MRGSWRVLILYLATLVLDSYAQTSNVSILLDELLDGYDRRFPPRFNYASGNKQVAININIYMNAMYSISEMNMDYSISMFLRERWIDERLAYNASVLNRFELDSTFMEKIWVPDLYILNEKETKFNLVTIPNKMVHIYPDGAVQISMRVTGAISCLMYLQKYPFDTQKCKLELESYSKSLESLKFFWTEGPVTVAEGIEFPQFTLVESVPYNCEKEYYGITYPCIGVTFTLERNYSYYIIQIFIPSILIVCLSWVNFWLDAESVPARISVGLLTVLTMTTQSSTARANLPMVSYIKAIDIWMAVCLIFVILALMEFAFVNVKSRAKKRQKSYLQAPEGNGNTPEGATSDSSEDQSGERSLCIKIFGGCDSARRADKLSRTMFPLSFAIFNAVYWTFYMLWDPDFSSQT